MNIADRVDALKKQLIESEKELEKLEHEWIQSIKSFETAKKNIIRPATTEGLNVMSGHYKETMSKQIELFRLNAEIIGKISPNAKKLLEAKINELEKNDRKFQKLNLNSKTTQEEIDPVIVKFTVLYDEIQSNVEIFRAIIQDTIKKFEK